MELQKKNKMGKKTLPNIQPYPQLLKPVKVSGLLIFRGDKKNPRVVELNPIQKADFPNT